jgi:hypothetical protein
LMDSHSFERSSTLQLCAEEPVGIQTKDPEHRAAGAGERSKAPLSWTALSQAPCICAGRFLVLAHLSGDPEYRHYPRKEGYGNAYQGFSSS